MGSLARITGLEVTNNFGERSWIEAAGRGAEQDWQRWSMYALNTRGDVHAADERLFLPPAVGKVLTGPPLETVNFIRDKMANMVWAVETTIPLETGRGTAGHKAALDTSRYLESITLPAGEDAARVENDAKIQYRAQTDVPDNWIPFVPVHVDGSTRSVQLQRAAMLRFVDGGSDADPIAPRTRLLATPASPYYIHEEEVPRAGAIVSQAFQRCRWHDGRVHVWAGRRKQTGRGEQSSGLRFDQIRDKS